jgi:cytochrome c-type biogenesis protein CcmH/NrfF
MIRSSRTSGRSRARGERAAIARAARICFVLLIALLFFGGSSAFAQQSERAKALGKRVKCMCGGCNDAAGLCFHSGGTFSGPCETAKAMLREIDEHIARGESDDRILKDFVQEYGPTVLVEPPKSGFNWTAWIVPIVAPLVALFALWFIVRRWRQETRETPGNGQPTVSPEVLARVRQEAEKSEL